VSDFEQRVKRGARSYWQGISPDPAFTERLIYTVELDAKQRTQPQRKVWSRIALAGLVASVLVAVSLPGVRAAATDVIRQVFHIGPVEYVVNSGSDPVPTVEEPVVNDLNPKPDADNRWFYTESGPLPAEGVAAVKAMRNQFRLPAWLPEDAPKRLQLPLEGDTSDPRYSLVVVSDGHAVMIATRWLVGYREFVGTTKLDAKPVMLGGREALELLQGAEINYYLSIDNVEYRVFGPTAEMEVVRRIAESLSSQDP